MHLVTRMSHTSSGLRASPSGWMNERVVGLAGGELHWLRGDSPCQLLNKRKRRKIGTYRRVSGRRGREGVGRAGPAARQRHLRMVVVLRWLSDGRLRAG